MTSDGLCVEADNIVLATGSRFERTLLASQQRDGVFVLDGASRYAELGWIMGGLDGVIVQGEGSRALQVAERLAKKVAHVSLFIDGWQHPPPSPPVWKVVQNVASRAGISFLKCPAAKVLGAGVLEAVVSGGRVLPCEALALVPRREPRTVQGTPSLGSAGGFLVDSTLRTSAPSTFAAGGCAELSQGCNRFILDLEASTSARIAGANASGRCFARRPMRAWGTTFFGLRWSCSESGSYADISAATSSVSTEAAPDSACTIVYDKRSGRVVSLETLEEADAAPPLPQSYLSYPATLRALAYGEVGGSSDISLVSDTARAGLEQWSRY